MAEAAQDFVSAVRASNERALADNPLRAALDSCSRALATSSRDHGRSRDTAWLYGILVGWECEDDHDDEYGHDQICGGSLAFEEIAAAHGWDQAECDRLRQLRAAVRAVTDAMDPTPPGGKP